MKKEFVMLFSMVVGYAHALDMPPSIPMLTPNSAESNSSKSQTSSCDMIPPMLHMLPPPLQSELDKCTNEKNFPQQATIKAYLEKNKIKYKSIKIDIAKEFVRLYEVDLGNGKKLFCNEAVTKCLKVDTQ